MKRYFLAITACVLFFAGCKETDVPLTFPVVPVPGVVAYTDTVYTLSSVPTAQSHNVLVEEFTGQSCSNCPAAHTSLEDIVAGKPAGSVNVVGLYLFGVPQAIPPTGSALDLRDSAAYFIGNQFYVSGGIFLPGAGIDRIPVSGALLLGSGTWAGDINTLLAEPDSVNLTVHSVWSGASAIITTTVIYTKPVTGHQKLTIEVVEDSIMGLQEFPLGSINSYTFTNVLRGCVTSPIGDLIADSMATKTAGTVYERTYTAYKLPVTVPAIVPQHCRIIAFVSDADGSNLQVQQSAQCPLAP